MKKTQHYEKILDLEWMLHRIQGQMNKKVERRVIMKELDKLSKELKGRRK